MFLVEDSTIAPKLLQHLRERQIGASVHYVPLHLFPFAMKHLGTSKGQFPVTERIAASMIRLPLYPDLSLRDCDYVIDQIYAFFHPDQVSSVASKREEKLSKETLDLTLILPCFNEGPHLPGNLKLIVATLSRSGLTYEILIIDDCSRDETPEHIQRFCSQHQELRIQTCFHPKNLGRGATVTEGIRASQARFVGFIDVDLEVSPQYIPRLLLPLQRCDADVCIGDRTYRFELSAVKRVIMSVVYRWLVRRALGTPDVDTESGCKFFRLSAVLPLLDSIEDSHWFWDTESTARFYAGGLHIASEPVLFIRNLEKQSTVKALRDSWKSFRSLMRFARRNRVECPVEQTGQEGISTS